MDNILLPYFVDLSPPALYYDDEWWVSKRNARHAAHVEWLFDRELEEGIDWTYAYIKGTDHTMHYRFESSDNAMLFKLRWAGV